MLVLNINRKPYIESPMALSHLTLSDLERQPQKVKLKVTQISEPYIL